MALAIGFHPHAVAGINCIPDFSENMTSMVESDEEEEKEILEDHIDLLKKINVKELVPKETSEPVPSSGVLEPKA